MIDRTPVVWMLTFIGLAAIGRGEVELKIGMIGLDTLHAPWAAAVLNDPAGKNLIPGARFVCACKDWSPDMERSASRIGKFSAEIRDKYKIPLVESISEVVARSDAIMILSVDGRARLRQARAVFGAGKPVFLDKPLAASLKDAAAIVRLARDTRTPFFSASSFRFTAGLKRLKEARIGRLHSAVAFGNCATVPQMGALFYEGIHAVEVLYTVLGPGCESLSCLHTPDGEVVSALWPEGRTGTLCQVRNGKSRDEVTVFGTRGVAGERSYAEEGMGPLVQSAVEFFRTRRPPVPPEETLEIIAFLEAADLSRSRGRAVVSVKDLLAKAKAEAGL